MDSHPLSGLERDERGIFIDNDSLLLSCSDPMMLLVRSLMEKEASRGKDEGELFCLICGDTQKDGDLVHLLHCDRKILCADCYEIQMDMEPSV